MSYKDISIDKKDTNKNILCNFMYSSGELWDKK